MNIQWQIRVPGHAPAAARRGGPPRVRTLALAGLLAGALGFGLAACRAPDPGPAPLEKGLLRLEQPYTKQKLGAGGSQDYKFHAAMRGVYLIMVYGNLTPLEITLRHPKKTCYMLGNGSCELVSGPDESYGFQINAPGDAEVLFNLMVTHSDGRGRFEGDVANPQTVEQGAEHSGTIGVYESSYYSFRAGNGGVYTIALTGARSDLLWRLFDAQKFDVILQECNANAAAADEVCQTAPLHPDTTYFVKVEERSGVPGPFKLTISGS